MSRLNWREKRIQKNAEIGKMYIRRRIKREPIKDLLKFLEENNCSMSDYIVKKQPQRLEQTEFNPDSDLKNGVIQ